MNLADNFDSLDLLKDGVITLGCFDGIHLGHQVLIQELKHQQASGLRSGLYFFSPHPLEVLQPGFQRLFLEEELEVILKNYDIDQVGRIPFDSQLSELQPEDFVTKLLLPYFRPRKIVVGYDFSFGKNRQGSVEDLRRLGSKHGFEVIQASGFRHENKLVSTSLLKDLVQKGSMRACADLLKRPFFFQAPVRRGMGRGRQLGFPTCNFSWSPRKIRPKTGLYKARVFWEDHWQDSLLNIGYKPTFKDSTSFSVELHIIQKNYQLYGKTLQVEIGQFLRNEQDFLNVEALKAQIHKDIEISLKKSFL